MNDLVSIITPAYNCAEVISETIESVINQTYENWEMIIINDCSTDNTAEIAKKYCKKDSRIKLVCMENNSGSADARNRGIKLSRGKYIALLDSDDLWKPEKLSRQISFMRSKQCAFSFSAYDVFRDPAETRRKIFKVPKSITYNQYLRNSIIGCLTVIIDKEKIPEFHMERGYLEDTLTWMYYLRKGIIAYGLNENLASYRVISGSKSSNKFENAKRFYACLKSQPELSTLDCCLCEIGYIWNALRKRLFSKKVNIIN